MPEHLSQDDIPGRFPGATQLTPAERETLLIKCWMSHDARWFMAAAQTCGMAVTNQINQTAARAEGKVEAGRIARALNWPPVTSAAEFMAAQAGIIGLLGPDLLDADIRLEDEHTIGIEMRRCFAFDNVTRAGVASLYDCGIFERIAGWLDSFGLAHHIDPPTRGCLMARGQACRHTIQIKPNPRP